MAHDHFQTPPDPKKGYNNPIWVLFWDVCDRISLHDLECNIQVAAAAEWVTFEASSARHVKEQLCLSWVVDND